jgi:hypothetical protein
VHQPAEERTMSTIFPTEPRLEAVSLDLPASQERSYLLLADLLDSPFEWSLCDVNAPTQAPRAFPAFGVH